MNDGWFFRVFRCSLEHAQAFNCNIQIPQINGYKKTITTGNLYIISQRMHFFHKREMYFGISL